MSDSLLLILVFAPVALFCIVSYAQAKKARTPITFLQFGTGYRSPSFFATLLASNSSLSGALFLIAFYGLLYGPPTFLWVFIFWFSTQLMSFYTVKWVDSIDATFITRRGTLHEFLGRLFGNDQHVRIAAARISMFCYVGLLACEIGIGYGIVSAFVPSATHLVGRLALEPALVTISVLALVAGYCAVSGFRAVVWTDDVQLILIAAMMLAVAWYLESAVLLTALGVIVAGGVISWVYYTQKMPREASTTAAAATRAEDVPELRAVDVLRDLPRRWLAFLAFGIGIAVWLLASQELGYPITLRRVINPIADPWQKFVPFFVIANILFWLVWWPAAMDQWHRCAATTDSRITQHWLLGTLGVVPVLYLGLLSLTFLFVGAEVAKHSPDSADPLGTFLSTLTGSGVSVSLFILMAIGLLAAMVSTVDSYLVVATQTWVSDIHEAKKTGGSLLSKENDTEHGPHMPRLRVAVILIFLASGVIAVPLLAFLTDVFAPIYCAFSGMLVLAGILGVGFFVKKRSRRQRMNTAVRRGMFIGMLYVVISNIPIILMLELTLREIVTGQAWYCNAGNWYYAVYINPVLAMLITVATVLAVESVLRKREVTDAGRD